ncbi:hypothetical protein PVBG_03038 [Plasmodium vivax Brazil I]|uniref:Uncharacterized protein n=1 Tax=Plasmodium vivax (strain Brazil I) TaxID=1033975 RepID=A0A0J9T1R7_PLAV1|nr:hypothetical protein PVBG_03038 [Plasmodium vivax Brazil I]
MNYSFLGRANRKATFTIVANYINLSQYELARAALHHLVVRNLLTRGEFIRGRERRKKWRSKRKGSSRRRRSRRSRRRKWGDTPTDSSSEKLYYLKKTLKFMRRYLSYGCCPLQTFSSEQSSAHFLLKVARDYNRFVGLILGNLFTCGVTKAQLAAQPWRSVQRLPPQLRPLLRKKYVPEQLHSKIAFDALLATIVVNREYYLCAFEDPSFFAFSLDTVQCLRRVYYLYVKAGELLLGRGTPWRKRDPPRNPPQRSSTRWKAKLQRRQRRLLNVFNRIVPFSAPAGGPPPGRNPPPRGDSPNRRAKQSYRPQMNETDELREIDELVLHICRVVYGEKADGAKANAPAASPTCESNEPEEKNKAEGTPPMHIIYIPPLHIINKAPIYNYINTFEEETSYFCQHDVVAALFRELFCLLFFLPALGVQLLRTLCLNESFFDFLLSLLVLSDGGYPSVGKYLQGGADGTPALGVAREGGVSGQMGESPLKENAPTEAEADGETLPDPVSQMIKNCCAIFTHLYYGVVDLYIDALVEKLKRKDWGNRHIFLYLLKFNHFFVNNLFFFSVCCASGEGSGGEGSGGEGSGGDARQREAPNHSSHLPSVMINGGDAHRRGTPPKNTHLAQKALHKVYQWLVLLVFHHNGEEGAAHHFGLCPEYSQPGGDKKKNKSNSNDSTKKRKNEKGEDVTTYKVLLRGVPLHLTVNYSHIRAIFFFYASKMRERRREEEGTTPKDYHKKSIIYNVLMSTNTFRCSDEGLVVNVLLHLFNYADDLYYRWVHTCVLYSPVRSGGKEDLLFCLNGSRIRGVHFLG